MEPSLAEKVKGIFEDCLFREAEIIEPGKAPEGAVVVEGILRVYGFHPGRLASHTEEIRSVLDQMPSTFHKAPRGGDGWSFLNLCMTESGVQWAEHPTMELLVVLGIAVGMVKYTLPRAFWSLLPGGMPYLVFDTSVGTIEKG